jgi:hypothetical protein
LRIFWDTVLWTSKIKPFSQRLEFNLAVMKG